MLNVRCSVVCLFLCAGAATQAITNPPVRALGGGWFQTGLVKLDKNSRTVTFPVSLNLRDETVEYAVVHKLGKTHESIFSTEARPQDIHVALLLLDAKPAMTNTFGADGNALPPGEKVFVEVSWTNGGARVTCPLEDLVLNRETKKSLSRGEWIYNGSNFSEGAFTAQRDGSIISIHIDPDAIINNPRTVRENDDLHIPNATKLPPLSARVEVSIRLPSAK
jgi:hypothetical protein